MTRRRPGYTIISLLVVVVIIALLWTRGAQTYFTPAPSVPSAAAASLPDESKIQVFKMTCDQARTAAAMEEAQNSTRPRTWNELQKFGLDASVRDPWNGNYYLKDGWIRCTGNPKAAEKL